MAMAESVGVTLSEDIAQIVGDVAMKELRAATLVQN
jgi:hypothetical protein